MCTNIYTEQKCTKEKRTKRTKKTTRQKKSGHRLGQLYIGRPPPIQCGPSKIKMVFIFLVWTIFRILINRICRLNVSIVIWKAVCFISPTPRNSFGRSSFSLNSTYVRNLRNSKHQKKNEQSGKCIAWKCTDEKWKRNGSSEWNNTSIYIQTDTFVRSISNFIKINRHHVAQSWCFESI